MTASGGAHPGRNKLAVLAYHKVGPPPGACESWFYVSEATFRAQLQVLADGGWAVLDISAFERALDDPDGLPERAALITFDDGYRSNLEIAVPCLEHFGFPAVVFVPTAFIGGTNEFDSHVEPEEPILGWSGLLEMERRRVAVQSHGVSHRAFSQLEARELRAEAGQSKRMLEEGLSRPVRLFSFPYGDEGAQPLDTAALLAEAGYRAAFLYGGGATSWPAVNRFALPRIPMGPDTDLAAALAYGERPTRDGVA
jgi:peptidoglycan/xylan/chitin deacetylase (PgdA/CDA1 family)